MEKGTIFQVTAQNGAEIIAIVLNVTNTIDDRSDRCFSHHICYGQNRIFSYFVTYNSVPVVNDQDEFGDDIIEHQTVVESSDFGEILVDYCIIPEADEALARYTEQEDTINHRMILLETSSGISIEQEIEICEAISKIISPSEKHGRICFDNLVYNIIDE